MSDDRSDKIRKLEDWLRLKAPERPTCPYCQFKQLVLKREVALIEIQDSGQVSKNAWRVTPVGCPNCHFVMFFDSQAIDGPLA